MAKPLLPDELWDEIAPLIPPEPPHPKGGRPFMPARACLTEIVFVLKTGCRAPAGRGGPADGRWSG